MLQASWELSKGFKIWMHLSQTMQGYGQQSNLTDHNLLAAEAWYEEEQGFSVQMQKNHITINI